MLREVKIKNKITDMGFITIYNDPLNLEVHVFRAMCIIYVLCATAGNSNPQMGTPSMRTHKNWNVI